MEVPASLQALNIKQLGGMQPVDISACTQLTSLSDDVGMFWYQPSLDVSEHFCRMKVMDVGYASWPWWDGPAAFRNLRRVGQHCFKSHKQ